MPILCCVFKKQCVVGVSEIWNWRNYGFNWTNFSYIKNEFQGIHKQKLRWYIFCMHEWTTLSIVFITKCVGARMDSKLVSNYHKDIVRKKVAKNVFVMNTVKHILTSSALYSLYCTLVMPFLNYFCEVWDNNYKTRIQSLFILRKIATAVLEFVWILITNAIQNHQL